MTWTFYNAQGQEKRAISQLLPVEYAFRSGGTGTYSIAAVAPATVTLLPLAPASAQYKSAGADDCFRINADGTITILQTGWYEITSTVAVSGAINANMRVDTGVWYTTDDTLPPNGGTFPNLMQAAGDSGPAGRIAQTSSQVAQLTAGTRIGVSVYHADSVSRNFYSERFGIARVGAGPQGASTEWLYGTGTPDNAGGDDGDLYLQDDGKVWDKQGAAWVYSGISLKGPAGNAGLNVVTTLPSWATVTHGQQVIYEPSIAAAVASPMYPVAWHLVANKGQPGWGDGWIVAGGEPIVTGNFPRWDNATAPGTPAAWASGPTITLPKGGTWRMRFGPCRSRLASTASAILQVETGLMRTAGNLWIDTITGGVARKQTIMSPANYAGADLSFDYTEQLGAEIHKVGQLFSGGTAQTLFNIVEGALVNPVRLSAMPVYLDP